MMVDVPIAILKERLTIFEGMLRGRVAGYRMRRLDRKLSRSIIA